MFDGQLTLFSNENRQSDKSPSLVGEVKIFGIVIQVSLWTKETKDGKKYWTGRIGKKEWKPDTQNDQGQPQRQTGDDDGMPF